MVNRFIPVIFVCLWSTGYIAMKFAAPYVEPFTFLGVRFSLVVVVLAPVLVFVGALRIGWREALMAALVGSLLHGVYLAAIFWALRDGMEAAVAALIIALQPIVAAAIVAPILGETVFGRHWAGLGLGIGGVLLVLMPALGALDGAVSAWSNWSLLAAGVSLLSITAGTALQKSSLSHVDVRATLVPQYVGATLVMAVASLLFETQRIEWTWQAIGALLWLVFVLSVGAISLFLMLLRRNEVWRTLSLFYLVPPITAILAWFCFNEALHMVQFVGMLLVVGALLLVQPKAPKSAKVRA